MKTIFLIIILFALPSNAVSTSGLSKMLSFTRGVYQVKKGSKPECISGKFEIFDADGKVYHMKAAESIFASNLHTKKLTSKDATCEIEYTTQIIKNGFVNTETMECIKPDTFYKRVLKVQKRGSKNLEYNLSVQDSKKAKKRNLRCRLKLVKKY